MAGSACVRRLVLWTLRGCGHLEGYGRHPGNTPVALLVAAGFVVGAEKGWAGACVGAAIMASIFVPVYLVGAYDRAKVFFSENAPEQAGL